MSAQPKKRGRPIGKHYNLRTCRAELNEIMPGSEYVRMRVLNLLERVAEYWFQAADGDSEEFEEWFNRDKK
jgi:hypothetical protein